MNLHIQILDNHKTSIYTYFIEIFNQNNIESLLTIDGLSIMTQIKVDSFGKIISELLYICKMNKYQIACIFGEKTCYVTISD